MNETKIQNGNTYIVLYKTSEEGVWEENIYTTNDEKEFNEFLNYLKKERVGNENFYSRVTNIRTIISTNNECNQLLEKLIKQERY